MMDLYVKVAGLAVVPRDPTRLHQPEDGCNRRADTMDHHQRLNQPMRRLNQPTLRNVCTAEEQPMSMPYQQC